MKQAKIGSFLKRKVPSESNTIVQESSTGNMSNDIPQEPQPKVTTDIPSPSIPIKIDLNHLPSDPADRPRIFDYDPDQREEIRRLYWVRGPCQPRGHTFPIRKITDKVRRFVVKWFDEFLWLEYSVKMNKTFCLCCYLFRDNIEKQGGNDAFVVDGFDRWNKKSSLKSHVGNVDSYHNRALQKCENLVKQNQSIADAFNKKTEIEKSRYIIRLTASSTSVRFCLKNECSFRAHDESVDSLNRGMFLEILGLMKDQNESIREAFELAPKNNTLTSPKIQKDLVNCFSKEIVKSICEEIGADVFSLLVDESSDVSKKEQMAVVLRYVDKVGLVKERFVGIVHVTDTCSSTLKLAIDSLFTEHNLSFKQVRGQGYDGASNMRGEFNGLKALILRENESAYYVHCFAHQVQLVVVAVAKSHEGVRDFFDILATTTNVVGASCKRKDIMRKCHKERLEKEIGKGEVETGRGKNQEVTLIRAGDTRWGSHHKTITSLMQMFPEVLEVLNYVKQDGSSLTNRETTSGILTYFKTLDFVFYLHLMLHILGLTDILSRHLQKKDQNILEAVSLVKGTKRELQQTRATGFPTLLKKVNSFCEAHGIDVVNMSHCYSKTRRNVITNQHHFEVDIFNTVLDMQIQEFSDRFSEGNTNLLDYMSALSPRDSFSAFDISKLVKLSEMYPQDFSYKDKLNLPSELALYHQIMRNDDAFVNLNSIAELARSMVVTNKHKSFRLVYRLLKLVLVLPVATATVERCFSKMKLVKTNLRNRMSDEFLNGALVCAIEKEELGNVTNEAIRDRFFAMKDRKGPD